MSDVTLDTSVFAHITKLSAHTLTYRRLLQGTDLVISFQTRPELAAAAYAPPRQARLEGLLRAIVELPHGHETSGWYTRGILQRKVLKRARRVGGDAGDADLWIIASALEYSIPLVSHDAQQVALGRAMGLSVFTALPAHISGNPQ